MTGSLCEKHGKYYVIVRVKDHTGKNRQKWISTGISSKGNNKRKAEAKMREILVQLDAEQGLVSEDMLFSVWLDKWMELRKGKGGIRENTLNSYRQSIDKHISPYFQEKNLSLRGIKQRDIDDYHIHKRSEGLSPSTLRRHNAIISSALKDAYRREYISSNPARDVCLPKVEKFHGKAYTPEDAEKLLAVLDGETLKPAVILALFYGLRRSEICGLRWQDIDFEQGTMHICNTVVRGETLIEEERTKSASSRRELRLIPATLPYLNKLKADYDLRQSKPGITKYDDPLGHVCTFPDGKPFTPDYISHAFKKLLARHNLPPIRFHELRHTAGSLLFENGLNAKEVQEFLGHSDISMTLRTYVHTYAESKEKAAHAMDSIFGNISATL